MRERDLTEVPESMIRKIKVPRLNLTTKTAEMMLSNDEVKAIVSKCKNSRDRAIVMLLYEGGFRIGELASLKWEQVKIEDWAAIINVMGKTAIPRMVPCVNSRLYLATYMNDYQIPYPPPKDEFVFWVMRRPAKDKPLERVGLEYQAVAKMIKIAARDAGIQKKVTPHLFRHSAITQAVREGLPETVLKSIMWGNVETGMLRTYSHLSNPDIENAIKARHGIPTGQDQEQGRKTFVPRICKFCSAKNVPTNVYCGQCGKSLEENVQPTQVDPKVISSLALALRGVIDQEIIQSEQRAREPLIQESTGNIVTEIIRSEQPRPLSPFWDLLLESLKKPKKSRR